jgi:hypothetical protein
VLTSPFPRSQPTDHRLARSKTGATAGFFTPHDGDGSVFRLEKGAV